MRFLPGSPLIAPAEVSKLASKFFESRSGFFEYMFDTCFIFYFRSVYQSLRMNLSARGISQLVSMKLLIFRIYALFVCNARLYVR